MNDELAALREAGPDLYAKLDEAMAARAADVVEVPPSTTVALRSAETGRAIAQEVRFAFAVNKLRLELLAATIEATEARLREVLQPGYVTLVEVEASLTLTVHLPDYSAVVTAWGSEAEARRALLWGVLARTLGRGFTP